MSSHHPAPLRRRAKRQQRQLQSTDFVCWFENVPAVRAIFRALATISPHLRKKRRPVLCLRSAALWCCRAGSLRDEKSSTNSTNLLWFIVTESSWRVLTTAYRIGAARISKPRRLPLQTTRLSHA